MSLTFENTPMIATAPLYRAALVSGDRGERVLRELVAAGAVRPVVTPTGRVLLTPTDGKRVFEAIVQGE